ncbi:uncharacterized protein LOC116256382 [Nymphaea colorata]|nr:uncharacterized protein LOC116256382 [Nymphaea colorata]
MKILRVYGGRRSRGNWAMVIHFKRNLFSYFIAAALFTSVVDGQYVPFEPEGKEKTTFDIMVGTVVAGIVVFAVIGVAVSWKYKKRPAKGDLGQPGTVVVHHSVEAQAAPAKVGNRTACRTTPIAAAAHHFTYSEILSIMGNFGMVVHYSMEAEAVPGKAGIENFLKETTFAAEESGIHAVCEMSSKRTADRTTPVTAAARHFTCNEILRIIGNFGMVVQHSMEAQAAPTNADSRTAMEKTASAAKESTTNGATEMSSTKTADETKPVAAAASPFTDNETLSFTGNFGLVILP